MSCGALASTKVVPELQYWINRVVITSNLNKYQIPFPPTFDESYLPDKSFIELLFNDNYQSGSYRYLYRERSDASPCPNVGWPRPLRERANIYANSAQYYTCDSDSTNVCNVNLFNLQDDDLRMLDALAAYRSDSTGVTLIDTTGSTTIIGSEIRVNYNALTTNLSKLICIYLKFKINGEYSLYNTTTLIASSSCILELSYEAYLIEEMFNFISARGI